MASIIDMLFRYTQTKPDGIAFQYMQDMESAPQLLPYKKLWQDASDIAVFLNEIANPGSRIMLFFPPGLAYIKAIFGCFLAGMITVPLYPPRRNTKADRIIGVAQNCQSFVALTTESELAGLKLLWNEQNAIIYH